MKKRKFDHVRQQTQCSGKHRYESSALAAAVSQKQRRAKGGCTAVNHYRCHVCGGYHIGTAREKSIKVARKRYYEKLTRREHE